MVVISAQSCKSTLLRDSLKRESLELENWVGLPKGRADDAEMALQALTKRANWALTSRETTEKPRVYFTLPV